MILILLGLSGLALGLLTALTVAFRRGRKPAGTGRCEYPLVSLLKPVKNIDDDLAANLESFYRLDYPAYEVLFAVFFTPFLSRQVEWRGGRIAIGKNTLIRVPANLENLVYEGA